MRTAVLNLFPDPVITTSAPETQRWISARGARATEALGQRVGRRLGPGSVLMLKGPIGSGKTTFVRGLARGLGLKVDPSEVVSPTFVLVHEYPCRRPLYHADLYRLDREPTGEDRALIEEYMHSDGVTAVEWAERAAGFCPARHLEVEFRHQAENERRIRIRPRGGFRWAAKKK